MKVIYTTPCGLYRVIEENGLFYPQVQAIRIAGYGLASSLQEAQAIEDQRRISYTPWQGFPGGYHQFSTRYKGDKSFKTQKGAIAFVDRCSENAQEVA